IVDPASAPQFIDPPADQTITCDDAIAFLPEELIFTNGESGGCEISGSISPSIVSSYNACGGTIEVTWGYSDPCGRDLQHTQFITVLPAELPVFIDPPQNTTLSCEEADAFSPAPLAYSNGEFGACEINGSADPQVTSEFDACGGQITVVWEFTDACGNTIEHIQDIQVTPARAPLFDDPPADITISCSEAETLSAGEIIYSNGLTGSCEVSGSVLGTLSGSYDACGGGLVIRWDLTDPCGNMIAHEQHIFVEPADPPTFVDAPENITVSCEEATSLVIPDLDYSNGLSGTCLVSGTISGVRTGSFDVCGGELQVSWNVETPCGESLSHVQQITVLPAPTPTFIDPPQDITISCNEAANLTAPGLSYNNGLSGSCEISGSAEGILSGNFDICGGQLQINWSYVDPCGEILQHTQFVEVEPVAAPSFLDLPADMTISCEEAQSFTPQDLVYSNAETGECAVEGTVSGSVTGAFDACGGNLSVNWIYV
ncbi:MAG: hypothetical protein R3330_13140, partial [Saprospiraceae bacterium]|nr:hypothetical protein [Saprospiraceae bacterium]